jgi:glutamate racemase
MPSSKAVSIGKAMDQQAKAGAPIGVFDSGVGGLSVFRDIRAALPSEHIIFVADSGHLPYGNKSQSYIQKRARALAGFLKQQHTKAIVIACNTATTASVAELRQSLDRPVVAVEPAVKPAAVATKTGVVGVLATDGTLHSTRFSDLRQRFAQGVEVVMQPAPGLVEQVEAGDLTGPQTRALVERYTQPLLAAGADAIVLGCTHYPFLRSLIAEVAGPDITVIETGVAVTRQLQAVLKERQALNTDPAAGREEFWTSGDTHQMERLVFSLLGRSVEAHKLPDDFAGVRQIYVSHNSL